MSARLPIVEVVRGGRRSEETQMPRVYPPLEQQKPTTTLHVLPPSLVEIVAGFSAGVVSTLVVHPFDVVKTRLQVDQSNKSHFGSSLSLARTILRTDGPWQGFYRGLTPNIIGNSISWGLYFMWYRNLKDILKAWHGPGQPLTSPDFFIASGASGVLTAVFTNPIWVIKTRMLSTSRKTPGAYTSIGDGTRQIWRAEGIKGFYRGLLPSLFGVSHGAIQFMAYEKLKSWRASNRAGQSVKDMVTEGAVVRKENATLSNWDFLTLSAVSKIFAGGITYPYQVVRARLQVYDAKERYGNARDVMRQVWAKEGLGGFYKGLGPNIIRVLPSTCVTFLVYENTKIYLPSLFDAPEETTTPVNEKK